ncbi:EutN/CcmL family microcompartment protein [Paenibacillus marinisediminis]
MEMGKVVGNVISTNKYDGLQGLKLLMVEIGLHEERRIIVAGDTLGAGVNQWVLVCQGSNVQHALRNPAPLDALIVGIMDKPPALQADL